MADTLKYAIGNGASTTLSSSVSNSATSMPLTSDTNFAAKSGEGMVIVDEGESTEELAYSTSKTGASLSTALANRGLEGGSAQAHSSGATVKGILTAAMWNDMIDALTNALLKTTGAVDTTKVVTPTGTQTLTNKSIDGDDNTLTDLPAANLKIASQAQGDILYYAGTAWARLAAGTSGQYLKTQGTGANPTWGTVSASVSYYVGSFTRDNTAASASVAYTGVGFQPTALIVLAAIDQTVQMSIGLAKQTAENSIGTYGNNKFTTLGSRIVGIDDGSNNGQSAVVASMDADGFTLTWTKNGTPGSGTITAYYLAFS